MTTGSDQTGSSTPASGGAPAVGTAGGADAAGGTDRPVVRAPQSDAAPTAPAARPATAPDPARTATTEQPGTTEKPEKTEKTASKPATPIVGEADARGGGRTAALWISLLLGAIVLVLLLIFIIQNNVTTSFQYLGTQFDLPLGVAMLLAAIAGALVMGLVGSVRIIQLSWSLRKLRKAQEKVLKASR
ncbi:LapA family protein [Brachybacterium sp. DNPG3]